MKLGYSRDHAYNGSARGCFYWASKLRLGSSHD